MGPVQRADLAEEREKLLRAYYSNAIPLELLKKEQDRIGSQKASAKLELESTEANLEGWKEVLSLAIRLAGNCHGAYLKARPKVRRRFNEAVLSAVYIKNGKLKKVEFSDPFDALFSRPSSNKALSVDGHYVNHSQRLDPKRWSPIDPDPNAGVRNSNPMKKVGGLKKVAEISERRWPPGRSSSLSSGEARRLML